MRILIDARSVRTPAGLQIFTGLAGGWARDPRASAVIAVVPAGFDRTLQAAGVEFVPAGGGGWLRHLLWELPRLADRVRADVIFSPNATPPRDPRSVMYCQDLKHFRPFGGNVPGWRWRVGELGRTAWRRYATAVGLLAVGTSRDIAQEVARRIPLPVITIPNGVDVGPLRWTGGQDRILVMGGIGPWKGEEVAITAWSLIPRHRRSGTILEIVGVDPPERRVELHARAAQLGVADSVEIAGILPRERFLERIVEARLAVSCSRFEAFGLPVAEALVLGAPVLCSDLPAHRELLDRAGAGAAFTGGDADSLAAALDTAVNERAPRRLVEPPRGWGWADRAAEHLSAYAMYLERATSSSSFSAAPPVGAGR